MTAIDWMFAAVCGQNAAHTWAPGGELLPFCQRCTGLYVGAFFALALHLLLKPRLTGRFLEIHGLFLLVMVPFGYHWLPQESILRTVTGLLFGAGLVTFLLVSIKPNPPELPMKEASALGYFSGLLLTGGLTLALAGSEWSAAGSSLAVFAVIGALTLFLMIGLNAAHYSTALWRLATPSDPTNRSDPISKETPSPSP